MIKAVIFDMYETLITHYECPLYFSAEMAKDAGISEENFRKIWRETETKRTIGKLSFEEVLERILKENNSYSEEKLRYICCKTYSYKGRIILPFTQGNYTITECAEGKENSDWINQ